jgi:Contractile injection system tube protein/LysM domain
MARNKLAKAEIVNTENDARLRVSYNPEEYKLEQGNNFAEVGIPGLPTPPLQYVRGRARALSMDLFFDAHESPDPEGVRTATGRLLQLLDKWPATKAPPRLLFVMGRFTFRCVLVDASQRYTMFRPNGTPVRATVSVRFQEYSEPELEVQRGIFVGPPTLHNTAAGQTLDRLAAQYLGDPSRWREIAKANGIVDPLNLVPGTPLQIPTGGGR